MMKRIFFPLLSLIYFLNSPSIVEARQRKKVKNVVQKEIRDGKIDAENKTDKIKSEIKNEIDEETEKIMEQNEKHKRQIAVKEKEKEDDGKSEEEKMQELIEIEKINKERENKEIVADKFLAKGVSDDELIGEEYIKWSTIKAQMTSKEFKRMYLENLKMKKVLQRYYQNQQKKQPAPVKKQEEQEGQEENVVNVETLNKEKNAKDMENFYIYGNYEDETGELSGDKYIKWMSLKNKATALQFQNLVKGYKFLQNTVKRQKHRITTLMNENEALKIKNKKLLRG